MLTLILKKIVVFLCITFFLSLISFFLIYHQMGSQESFIVEYGQLIQHIFTDYASFNTRFSGPFGDIMQTVFFPTLKLFAVTLFVSVVIGFPTGLFLGLWRNAFTHTLIWCICLFFASIPMIVISFMLTILLIPNELAHLIASFHLLFESDAVLNVTYFNHLEMHQYGRNFIVLILILSLQPCAITIQVVAKHVQAITQKKFIKLVQIQKRSLYDLAIRHILPNIMPQSVNQLLSYTTTTLFFTLSLEIFFNYSGIGTFVYYAFLHHELSMVAIAIILSGFLVSSFWLICQIFLILFYPFEQREFES